jgi:CRISPR-associated endoribonuclease Cas6
MPVELIVRLRAARPLRPDTRLLHGLACALFEGTDSAGHDGHDKPFAVWPLLPPASDAAGLRASDDLWVLRAGWLPDGPPPAATIAPAELRVGSVTCPVAEASHRAVSFSALATGPACDLVRVTFRSPTFFAHNGSDVLNPDPRLIAGSWRRRWNASLPADSALAVTDNTWRQILQAVELADYDLETQARDSGHGRERTGFTGTATLRLAREAPSQARHVLGALARFATFCGTGAQCTHGFGATSTDILPRR